MAEWLKASASGRPVGVDRERNVIQGFVVAQEGPFKSGRGEFDLKSLKAIRALMNKTPSGLKSRFTHPDLSNDGLGKFLGRAKKPTLEAISITHNGEALSVHAIRADLYLADSSFKTPSGDLGSYVLDLADEDSDALSSSLVLQVDEEQQLDDKGRQKVDAEGNALPPLWRPKVLHATDIVDTGDAVDGLLSASLAADGLPDDVVRQAAALLKSQFDGKPRSFVEPRLRGWVDRVLAHYYPSEEDETLSRADGDLIQETLDRIQRAS